MGGTLAVNENFRNVFQLANNAPWNSLGVTHYMTLRPIYLLESLNPKQKHQFSHSRIKHLLDKDRLRLRAQF